MEVLISIALVLLIILGVNQVFALTSRTISAGNAMSTILRDARNAQTIITQDLSNAEIDRAPFLYLQSEVLLGFRDRADQLADRDYSPTTTTRSTASENTLLTVDRDGNGADDPPESRAFLTTRSHRADVLKFFSRQSGRRQTANANAFTSGVSASELYITYGHLRQPTLPDNLVTGQFPGIGPTGTLLTAATNRNNFYATQWVLGRNAFLLREPVADGSAKIIPDTTVSANTPQTYYGRGSTATSNSSMHPFNEGAPSTADGAAMDLTDPIQYSIYDLIGIGMERYRYQILPIYINGFPDGSGTKRPTWYQNTLTFRHTGYPAPSRPLTSQGVARTVPCFVNACTQFVVEYAGDFVTQNEAGTVTAYPNDVTGGGTDGIVDFSIVDGRRVVRWYGFPRDLNADGRIEPSVDVVPLRDYLPSKLYFERTVPALQSNYGIVGGVGTNVQYLCVWGPDTVVLPRPKMIRIVMAIDDPASRIANEQYFEFVVELP